MTPTDTVRQFARGGISLAQRPIAVAAYAAGVVRGTVRGALRMAETVVDEVVHAPRDVPVLDEHSFEVRPDEGPADAESVATGERTQYGGLNTEPAPPMTPGGGGESFEHEPTAESRDVAHGDAAAQPREVDSWVEEVETAPEEDLEASDAEPLLDPADAKALRRESEILRRAANPDKG